MTVSLVVVRLGNFATKMTTKKGYVLDEN